MWSTAASQFPAGINQKNSSIYRRKVHWLKHIQVWTKCVKAKNSCYITYMLATSAVQYVAIVSNVTMCKTTCCIYCMYAKLSLSWYDMICFHGPLISGNRMNNIKRQCALRTKRQQSFTRITLLMLHFNIIHSVLVGRTSGLNSSFKSETRLHDHSDKHLSVDTVRCYKQHFHTN